MNGVLILAHGSKRKETEETMNALVEKVKMKTGEEHVYPAFLQFSEINLQKGIEKLVGIGCTNIKVIPMFLFEGVHVTKDIPKELLEINQMYPQIQIRMSKHIGADERLADILVNRIQTLEP